MTLPKHISDELMTVVKNNWHSGAGEIIDFNKFLDEIKDLFATILETEVQKAVEAERSKVVNIGVKLGVREDGTRTFNGMPDYEYLKIEAINRVAEAIESLSHRDEKTINFPQLIADTREKLSESGIVFGRRFGVSHAAVSDWERGKSEAPYAVISFCLSHNKEEV